MKTYKGIIFDLDGTLLDTIEDLRDSVNDVMKIYGWKEHDTKACKQMVGNGFRKLITRALPEDKQKNELFIDEAVNQFSKAYQKRYLNKTIPYEGILKLLESLEEKGIKIAVNSNKRGDYTSALVNKYFSQFPWTAVYGERESEGIPQETRSKRSIRNRRFDETSQRRNFIYWRFKNRYADRAECRYGYHRCFMGISRKKRTGRKSCILCG